MKSKLYDNDDEWSIAIGNNINSLFNESSSQKRIQFDPIYIKVQNHEKVNGTV